MSEENIKHYAKQQLDVMIANGEDRTDWARVDAMTDEDIVYDADAPATDEKFWKNARLVIPQEKPTVTLDVDRDVLQWFQSQGDYKSRMKDALRQYVNVQKEHSR